MKKTTSKTHSISRIVPVIIAVLVCVSVSGLAGCGSSKQDQSVGDSSAESAEASSCFREESAFRSMLSKELRKDSLSKTGSATA